MISLHEHQLAVLDKLENGKILCGTVGTGKSITGLSYYYLVNGGDRSTLTGGAYIPMKDPIDLYIITTARKRDTLDWDAEMLNFFIGQKGRGIYSNTVVVDSWNNIKKYTDVKDAFFIFDEDRVTGSGAWVQAFYKIAKKNQWIILSATPGDTWSDYIPVFVANGFYRNKSEFNNEHCVYSRFTKFPKIERYINTGRLIRLRKKILVMMDDKRHTEEHHTDILVDYDSILYKTILRNRWNIWEDKPLETAGDVCLALRKVVNSSESRLNAVLKLFEEHPRLIIFYNFDYELELLRNLDFHGVEVAEWNGHKHQPLPEGKSWVYLVQYLAGAEGWNAITTDTIIFYSQNYSYKTMTQAAGRINRLNTPYNDLYYYHLKSKSSIDLAIAHALKQKKDFNQGKFIYG